MRDWDDCCCEDNKNNNGEGANPYGSGEDVALSLLSAWPFPQDEEDGGLDGHDTGYVEAGTKTTVGVSASAYDDRPGESGDDVGCGEDGCLPALAHDGIGEEDVESRWSCAEKIVPDGGQCEIEFAFGSPQNILDVEVAF